MPRIDFDTAERDDAAALPEANRRNRIDFDAAERADVARQRSDAESEAIRFSQPANEAGIAAAGGAIKTAGSNVARGAGEFVAAVPAFAGTVADYTRKKAPWLDLIPLPGESIAEARERYELAKIGGSQSVLKDVSEIGRESVRNFAPVEKEFDEQFVAGDVARGLGQVGAMLGTGGVAALAGAGVKGATATALTMGFAAEFEDAFDRSTARGDSADLAMAKSLGYATVASMIENALGAGRLLRKYFGAADPAAVAKKLTSRGVSAAIAKDLAAGMAEEGSQRLSQDLIVDGKPDWEGIKREALAGGVVQALVGAPGNVRQPRTQAEQTPPPPPAPTATPPPLPPPAAPPATPNSASVSSSLVVPPTVKDSSTVQPAVNTSTPIVEQPEFKTLTPAQRSELEDIAGSLEAAQLAGDLDQATFLKELLELKKREFYNPQPAKSNAPQNVPQPGSVPVQPQGAAPVGKTPVETSGGNRPPSATGGTPKTPTTNIPGLGGRPQKPTPVTPPGRPDFTKPRNQVRGDAAVTAPPRGLEPSIQREPVVDPDLAGAINAVREGYNPEVDASEPTAPAAKNPVNPPVTPDAPTRSDRSELMTPEEVRKEAVRGVGQNATSVWKLARSVHRTAVLNALKAKKPVSAIAADEYQYSEPDRLLWRNEDGTVQKGLPTGYIRQGDRYVFQPVADPKPPAAPPQSPPVTPPTDPRMAEILRKRAEIQKRLRDQMKKMGSGPDPEFLGIAAELIASYAEEGVIKFKDFAKRVKADMGDIWEKIKPLLHVAWTHAGAENPALDDLTRSQAAAQIAEVEQGESPAPAPPNDNPLAAAIRSIIQSASAKYPGLLVEQDYETVPAGMGADSKLGIIGYNYRRIEEFAKFNTAHGGDSLKHIQLGLEEEIIHLKDLLATQEQNDIQSKEPNRQAYHYAHHAQLYESVPEEVKRAVQAIYTQSETSQVQRNARQMDELIRMKVQLDKLGTITESALGGYQEHGISTFEKIIADWVPSPKIQPHLDRVAAQQITKSAPPNEKQAEEEREFEMTVAARNIATGPGTPQEKYAALVNLYTSAKKFGIRTADSKTAQAYSTPPPLAYLVGLMADLASGQRILEPTAGNGMLLITANPEADIVANELDDSRFARLKRFFRAAGFATENPQQMDATHPNFNFAAMGFKPDRLAANPPFGSTVDAQGNPVRFPIINGITAKAETPSIDLAIMLNSLEAMTPDGKAVFVIGSKTGTPNPSFGTDANRIQGYNRPEFLELFNRFNVVDMFTVDGSLYEGMGAGWPVDVIMVSGKGPTPSSKDGGFVRPWVKPPQVFRTWQELETKVQQYADNNTEGRPPVGAGSGSGGTLPKPGQGGGQRPGVPRPAGGGSQPGNPPRGGAPAAPGGNPGAGSNPQPGGGGAGQPPGGGESPAGSPPVDAIPPEGQGPSPGVVGGSIQPAGTGIVEGRLNVPYVPVSQNGDPKLVSPTNLADAMRSALVELERQVGMAVDDFVANRIGWTKKHLFASLSAAQIDAVALAIRNIERGSALINGDQTGVGKGRTAAAIIEYAKKVGKIPIFITAKKTLYEDMAGRDLPAVGNKNLKPFITDSSYKYVDGNGNEVKSNGSKREELEEIARTGKLPRGTDAFFTTYEQLKSDKPQGFSETTRQKASRKRNRTPKPDGPRYAALRALAPNAIIIMDEAHVAAGQDSDLNLKLQDELLPLAGGVYMLTATFSKRPDNLGLYSVPTLIARAGIDTDALVELLQRGGNALQQALSSMLSRAGEFIRREQNYEGVKIKFVAATPNPEAEAEAADTYTSFLGDLKRLASQVNAAAADWADDENQSRPQELTVDVANINFGSRLFNLSQQYLLALRAPNVVREALKVLSEPQLDSAGNPIIGPDGRPLRKKPFISLYNTMAGPITDLQSMGLPFTFNGILMREMKKMLTVTVRDPLAQDGKRKVTIAPEDLPDGGAFYYSLEDQIKATDLSQFPISPIDYIKDSLKNASVDGKRVTVGEITARDGELTEEGGEIQLSKREQGERNTILRDYNNGGLDVILVNGASSTGVSAHTDPRFRDLRQRVMIVAQPQPDITAMMQMLGRIMRFGQVNLPEYIFLRSSLAAEKRFLTMLRGKLASLNANTSADTESDVTKQEDFAEDIFNEIGDEVVFRVLSAHPEEVALAQISMPTAQQGSPPDTSDFARKATGSFVLLPNQDAQNLWNQIDEAYRNEIRLLDEVGENPLKATPEDLRAETLSKADFVPGTGETIFDGPATLEKVKVQLTNRPMTHDEAMRLAKQNEHKVRGDVSEWLQKSRVAERERLATSAERGATEEQLERTRKNFQEAREKVSQAFSRMGRTFGVDSTGTGQPMFYGVVVDMRLKGAETADFSSASRQDVILATNTARRTVTFAVSRTEGREQYLVDNLPGTVEELFNSTSETNTTRYIVTGNVLKGADQALNQQGGRTRPRVVVFTRQNGNVETGILMPTDYDPAAQPVSNQRPIRTAQEFAAAIASDTPVAAGEVRIIHGELTVPASSAWRRVWGNPRFRQFVPYAKQTGSVFSGELRGGARAEELFQWLQELGLPVVSIGTAGGSSPRGTSIKNAKKSGESNQAGSAASAKASLEGSREVLRATPDEVARLLDISFREHQGDSVALRKTEKVGSTEVQPVTGGGIYSGSAPASKAVFDGARVVIETPREGLRNGRVEGNIHILAARILGKITGATRQSEFNLRLIERMAGLKFVFVQADKEPKAAYFRELNVVRINTSELAEDDLSDPLTQATWDAILNEEIIHAVTDSVASNAELAEVWRSISPEERKNTYDAYDRAGKYKGKLDDTQLGSEYLRMVMQERLFGRITEEHEGRKYTALVVAIFNRAITFIRKVFGQKPSSPLAQQVIERLEWAIRGDAPIAAPIWSGDGQIAPRGTSLSETNSSNVNLSQATVDLAASKVADYGTAKLKEFERASASLDELAYENAAFKKAKQELNRLVDIATGRIQKMTEPNWTLLPDQDEGVGVFQDKDEEGNDIDSPYVVADESFSDKLDALGVPHDRENVMDLQKEIHFEKLAHRLVNAKRALASHEELLKFYLAKSAADREVLKENIEFLNRSIAQRHSNIDKAESVLQFRGKTNESVGSRAAEIERAQNSEIENRSKAGALNVPQVQEVFGEPSKDRDNLIEMLRTALKEYDASWVTRLAMQLRWGSDAIESTRKVLDSANPAAAIAGLGENQQQIVRTVLAKLFQKFDANRLSVQAMHDMKVASLSKRIQKLKMEQADAQEQRGRAQILVADILKAEAGNSNVTGTLQTQAEVQALRERIEAVLEFARRIGANRETNKALYNWITTGFGGAMPNDPATVNGVGLDPETLRMIMSVAKNSPEFGSAITALIRHAAGEITGMPAVSLKEIAEAVQRNGKEEVKQLIQRMKTEARASVSEAAAAQRRAANELADLQVEVGTWREALAMFDSVAGSSDFNTLRSHIEESDQGYVKAMKLDNQHGMTLLGFGVPGKTVVQKEIRIIATGGDDLLKWRDSIAEYFKAAKQYVLDYEFAKAAFESDPSQPSPASLGYDVPTVRGLKQALISDMPQLLDWTNTDFNKTVKAMFPERWSQGSKGIVGRVMRTMERTTGLLRGILGNNAAQAFSDWVNGDIIGNAILHRFQNIDGMVSAAMRSHKSDGIGLNKEVYQDTIFNELAHESRRFTGSSVGAGFKLPRSGVIVTPEDMALLRRVHEMSNAERREIEEHRTDRGVVENVGGRDLVRKGASPGDLPLTRTLSYAAGVFVNKLVTATVGMDKTARQLEPSTDLTTGSSNPLVQFWNQQMPALLSHVHDAERTDRSVKVGPAMQAAYTALARDIRSGAASKPTSLEELVELLTARVAVTSGVLAKDYVVRQLSSELEQFHAEAMAISDTIKKEADKTSGGSVAVSGLNEFTKPAALLRLPSTLYTYGSLTPGQRLMSVRRANHENAVRFIAAHRQAINQIRAAVQFYTDEATGPITDAKEKQAFAQYGSSLREAKQILAANEQAEKEFEAMFRQADTIIDPGMLSQIWSITAGSLLAQATVLINNVVFAGMTTFMAHTVASRYGKIAAAAAVVKHVVGAAVKGGLLFTEWLARSGSIALDSNFRKWLGSTPGKRFVADGIRGIAEDFLGVNPWADLAEVQRIGFSQRDKFWQEIMQGFKEIAQFDSRSDEQSVRGSRYNQIRRLADRSTKALLNVAQQSLKKGGVEAQDLLVNTNNMALVRAMEQNLKEFSIRYGKAREALGMAGFDFTDARWQARADEFFASPLAAERDRAMALLREKFRFAAGSTGLQLESAMWNYYQAQKTNPEAEFFTDAQRDNFSRQSLADLNASTKANRPSSPQSSAVERELFKFMGYPANLLGQMAHQFALTRGTPMGQSLAANSANLVAILMVGAVVGLVAGAGKEEWKRRARGEIGRNLSFLQKEFWDSPESIARGTAMAAMSAIPFVGGLAMQAHDFTTGGKGFDPAGSFLLPSVLSRWTALAKGAYNLPWGHKSEAVRDFAEAMAPFYKEAANVVGLSRASRNTSNIVAEAVRAEGLPVPKRTGSYTQSYTPLTGVRRKLERAIGDWGTATREGDSKAAERALAEATAQKEQLVAYYRDEKKMTPAQAEAAAWRDYQDMNPLRKAYGGKVMTDEELSRVMKRMGDGDRGTQAKTYLNDFKEAGQKLFGKTVSNTKVVSVGREEPELKLPTVSSGGGSGGGIRLANYGSSAQGSSRYATSRIRRTGRGRVVGRNRLRSGGSRSARMPRIRIAKLPRRSSRNRLRV